MTFTIRRSTLAVSVVLLMISAGLFAASRATAASSTPVVYVAVGDNFPDALGAASAAAVQGGPVLLVQKTSIPSETKAELIRLSPDVIYVSGGPAVISDAVFNALKAYAPTVTRVAGSNRYGTAAAVSQSAFPATGGVGGGDADTLDGFDSSYFLPTTGQTANTDLLDGYDSSDFIRHGQTSVIDGAMVVDGTIGPDDLAGGLTSEHIVDGSLTPDDLAYNAAATATGIPFNISIGASASVAVATTEFDPPGAGPMIVNADVNIEIHHVTGTHSIVNVEVVCSGSGSGVMPLITRIDAAAPTGTYRYGVSPSLFRQHTSYFPTCSIEASTGSNTAKIVTARMYAMYFPDYLASQTP